MNGGVIIPDKDTARALNDLARHTAIVRILNDIRMDMEICEIEGWDKNEYLNLIRQLLNSIGGGKTMDDQISRQAAIDLLKQMRKDGDMVPWEGKNVFARIRELPSVQPETCEGCKHLGKWENEVEYGCSSPCTRCKRRVMDNYER